MFFLGILAILQIGLLPGLLILKVAGFRAGVAPRLVLSFAFSLLANYLIVTVLVVCAVYRQPIVLALIAVEIIAVLWLYRSELTTSFALPAFTLADCGFAFAGALLLAVDSVLWALLHYVRNLGTVFRTWDAVLSWNRWALVWTGGAVPHDIQYYPQLIPANWSLTYVLTRSADVQAFAKASTGLCLVAMLVSLLYLALRERSYGHLLGVAFTALLARKCLGEFIGDGYVDIPVAFFAVVSVCLLLFPADAKALWFSCAAAAGAALTKQAGLYFFVAWPFLVAETTFMRKLRTWLVCLIPVIVFYGRQFVLIRSGYDFSNIAYVTQDIYKGARISARVIQAFRSLGIYAALFALVVLALPFLPRVYRRIALVVVIPFSAIWAMFFSYDNRNIMLALPFVGLAAGVAVERIAGLMPTVRRIHWVLPIALIVLALIGLAMVLRHDRIVSQQIEARKQLFCAPLNAGLYDYFRSHRRQGLVVTDYPLEFLPGFDGAVRRLPSADPRLFERPADAGYLLVPATVAARLPSAEYERVFDVSSDCRYSFFRIVRK